MKRPEIVNRIREALRRTAPGVQAILYGSEARGDARPDSDIDILILVDKDKNSLSCHPGLDPGSHPKLTHSV